MYFKLSSAKLLLPAALIFATSLLLAVPNIFLSFGSYTPFYTLILIYYWYLYFPSTLPTIALLALGLMSDAILGLDFGISSITFITFQLFIALYKRFIFTQSFVIVWTGFAVCSLCVIILKFAILSYFKAYDFKQLYILFAAWYISCLIYPVLHYFLDKIAKSYKIHQG